MNRLKGTRIYLAGNIDGLDKGGNEWRDEFTPFLNSLGVVVLNPCKKPTNLIRAMENEDENFRNKKRQLKQGEKFQELKDLMQPIAYADLAFIDRADCLIVGLDMDAKPCGTIWELAIANLARKPIIVVCKGGKKQIPDWMYALLKFELFFDTWDEVKEYLKYIDSSEKIDDLNGRWKLFKYE